MLNNCTITKYISWTYSKSRGSRISYSESPTYEKSFMFRRTLVPIDGSESSLKALDLAVDLAKHYGSEITVVYAKPKGVKASSNVIASAKKRVEKTGVDVKFKVIEYDLDRSSVASTILNEIIEGNYDLVVMSARGLILTSEINIGSNALAIVSNSLITVTIVR